MLLCFFFIFLHIYLQLRFAICILYNKWTMIIQNTQTVGLRKDNSILRTHNQVPE